MRTRARESLIYSFSLIRGMQFKGAMVSLVLLVALLGCVNQPPATQPPVASGPGLIEAPAGLSGYNNFKYGVAMNYPTGWQTDETDPNAIVIFKAPAPAGATIAPTVNLTLNDLQGKNMSLDDFLAAAKSQLSTTFPGYAEVESGPTTMAGLPAQKLVFTMTGGKGQKMKLMQVYVIQNEIGYALTYTAEEANYADFEAGAQAVIGSFKITKNLRESQ